MPTIADCEHCGHTFGVPNALTGGITNCPECGKATSVAGLRDPLWRFWQFAALGIAVAIGFVCSVTLGPAAGWTAGVVAALGLWLISRAF